MEFSVRRAKPEDAPGLASLEVTTWRAAYRGLMPNAFLDGLSEAGKGEVWRLSLLKHGPSGRKRVLVAESDAGLIGFVRVGASSDVAGEDEVGLVYLVYVLPTFWGLGVGGALMDAAMAELRDLGLRDAVLWVLGENRRARRFYEGLGWRWDGQTAWHDYGGTHLEALRYRREVEV